MSAFPIWDMFTEIGSVTLEEIGLYYSYHASIKTDRPGFIRLYCHNEKTTVRMGLFYEENTTLCCHGRISRRSVGSELSDCRFSIQEQPFLYLKTHDISSNLHQNALLLQEKGRRFVAIPHKNGLPDEVLPYFCFLRPEVIDRTNCLVFDMNLDGTPKIPELME